jgi:hypothetical protein
MSRQNREGCPSQLEKNPDDNNQPTTEAHFVPALFCFHRRNPTFFFRWALVTIKPPVEAFFSVKVFPFLLTEKEIV